MHELAVSVSTEVNLPRPHVFQVEYRGAGYEEFTVQRSNICLLQGLQMLLQNALEKLASRDKFKESGVATFKLRCSKNLKCRQKSCDISIQSSGQELVSKRFLMP